MSRQNGHHLLVILLAVSMVLTQVAGASAQSADTGTGGNTATATDAVTVGDPDDCIDPLKEAHIAATISSLLPIPGFSDGADAAEYLLNLALKDCTPVVDAPTDQDLEPSEQTDYDSDPCTYRVHLPLSKEDKEIIVLDRQVISALIDEIEADPLLKVPQVYIDALRSQLVSTYGRFETKKYGEYQNIYGVVFSSSSHGADWGDLGTPSIYHYNTDVRITATHSGQRIDDETIQYLPGTHTVFWRGDSTISFLDFIPPIPGPFDNPVGEKVAKRTAQKSFRAALRKAAREAIEKGNKEFAKRVAKETAKAFVEELAKNTAEKVFEEAAKETLNSYFSLNKPRDVYTVDNQTFYILDSKAPVISGAQDLTVEALEPGGVSSARAVAEEIEKLTVSDDCDPDPSLRYSTPAFWALNLDGDGNPRPTAEIVWIAEDNGAASASGGRNETRETRSVTVVDTKPPILVAPPPVVMEGTGVVNVSLGMPRVFDVADLRPSISSDAPAEFMPGLYRIQWRATDASRNVSAITPDTEQIVNIKAPGTNVLPTAFDQTGADAVSAIADEPTRIVVRGQDGNTSPDPLWFSIENQPENGYFIAPLYPYFIEDYRMAARYSPSIAAKEGEEFAWDIASSTSKMSDYMKTLCAEDINREDLPKDFVSWVGGGNQYIAVDDEGYSYIYDFAYRKCHHGGGTIAPNGSPRISVWDPSGLYVGEQVRSNDGRPLRDINFNIARGTIIAVSSDGSSTGNSLVDISTIQLDNPDQPIVEEQSYTLWNEINTIYVGEDETARGPEYKNAGAAAWDNTNGVLYVIGDPNQNLKGMAAFKPAECNNTTNKGPDDCLDLLGTPIYSTSIIQSTKWGEYPGVDVDAMRLARIRDITLDSQGAVYIVAEADSTINGGFDRIYKFAPAEVQTDGSVKLGEFLGWLGRCDDGPNCNYIDQHSIGFSCTDETCSFTDTTRGDRPGQLDNAAAIEMDPNDVLYVADSGNSRVQRFNSDGLFAGEARSTGDGSGFVLGDFGRPGNIAVNSGSFYIIDIDRDIVHVFDAAVINGIDDTSAWVEYQSDSNYRGTDRFIFSATDGFRTNTGDLLSSAPATVEINVSRNFRPPDAADNIMVVTQEDTPTAITLAGSDLDGDNLTFEVTSPPLYGELSGTPPNLIYTPNTHFFGEDSMGFVAVDDSGHPDNRSEPETVSIFVQSVNDTPMISFPDGTLRSGAGYPLTLDARVFDPDPDEDFSLVVNWGDGTVENEGEVLGDGSLSGPIIVIDENGDHQVRGYHTYADPGTYTIEVCVTDATGSTGCGQKLAVVELMADLAVDREGPYFVGAGTSEIAYTLKAENLPPSSGGVSAVGVVISETLTDSLSYVGSVTGCSISGQTLTCPIGSLAPGEVASVDVNVRIPSGAAVGVLYTNEATVSQTGNDPISENDSLLYDITVVHAADFIVDSYEDHRDNTPGDGLCETLEGYCTLRAAVIESNALAGRQSIALAYGVYLLNPPPTGNVPAVEPQPDDQAYDGDLDILDDVVILGLSADSTVIHANSEDRVIEAHPSGRLQLFDSMLTGGSPLFAAEGGGLLNSGGDVTLIRTSIIGNFASNGGGIANSNGTILVGESTIMGNTATGSGGGVNNLAEMTLRNVTLTGNRAQSGGALAGERGVAQLENVTMTDNTASSSGGGISSPGETVVAVNTIIADNDAPTGPACGAAFRSEGYNLIDQLDDCSVLGKTDTNVIGEDADLEALELNAANTFSQTPAADSRIVDRGSCRLEFDQRGMQRPYGVGCDIGAVELGSSDIVAGPTYRINLPMVQK